MPRGKTSAPKATREQQLLSDWLAKAGNVTLACWDEGHWWWTDDPGKIRYSATANGIWGMKEPCMREVDGEGCGVQRTRFINPVSGLLDGPSAAYDYSGAPRHRMPKDPDTGYSILGKNTRAAIRLERKRRGHLGEDTR